MSVQNAIISFLAGSTPPVQVEGEDPEAFQNRTLVWVKEELRINRVLAWMILLLLLRMNLGG